MLVIYEDMWGRGYLGNVCIFLFILLWSENCSRILKLLTKKGKKMVYLFLSLCLCSWSLLFPKHSSIVFLSKSYTSFRDLPECCFLSRTSVAVLLDELFLWIRQMSLLILSSALGSGSLCTLWLPSPHPTPWPESIGLGAGGWGGRHTWLRAREYTE